MKYITKKTALFAQLPLILSAGGMTVGFADWTTSSIDGSIVTGDMFGGTGNITATYGGTGGSNINHSLSDNFPLWFSTTLYDPATTASDALGSSADRNSLTYTFDDGICDPSILFSGRTSAVTVDLTGTDNFSNLVPADEAVVYTFEAQLTVGGLWTPVDFVIPSTTSPNVTVFDQTMSNELTVSGERRHGGTAAFKGIFFGLRFTSDDDISSDTQVAGISTISHVPEPSTAFLGLYGVAYGLLRRKRR